MFSEGNVIIKYLRPKFDNGAASSICSSHYLPGARFVASWNKKLIEIWLWSKNIMKIQPGKN